MFDLYIKSNVADHIRLVHGVIGIIIQCSKKYGTSFLSHISYDIWSI